MIKFYEDFIEFLSYPFASASIFPSGRIQNSDINEILLDQIPPEIRTINGEVLFVEASFKDRLKEFAQCNQIPIASRVDTWGLILNEFLDTEFNKETKERVIHILESCGIRREEVEKLRETVREVMIAYNFESMLWEWVHLGLYDLLKGYSGILAEEKFKLPEEEFNEFYKFAMTIANKGILRG